MTTTSGSRLYRTSHGSAATASLRATARVARTASFPHPSRQRTRNRPRRALALHPAPCLPHQPSRVPRCRVLHTRAHLTSATSGSLQTATSSLRCLRARTAAQAQMCHATTLVRRRPHATPLPRQRGITLAQHKQRASTLTASATHGRVGATHAPHKPRASRHQRPAGRRAVTRAPRRQHALRRRTTVIVSDRAVAILALRKRPTAQQASVGFCVVIWTIFPSPYLIHNLGKASLLSYLINS